MLDATLRLIGRCECSHYDRFIYVGRRRRAPPQLLSIDSVLLLMRQPKIEAAVQPRMTGQRSDTPRRRSMMAARADY